MPGFTVDTHLFRELGELLVGRDSTALVELIKNAYDADATHVTVHGEALDDPDQAQLVITDDGVGMTPELFERGFLRIASRVKEEGERRSPLLGRRFTGAKGVGRLAAHKLARQMAIYSIPDPDVSGDGAHAVSAAIDWDLVEAQETLKDVESSNALSVGSEERPDSSRSGTILELRRLRRKWTPAERSRLFWEVQTFQPAGVLLAPPPETVDLPLLFGRPRLSDVRGEDPGCRVELTGDLETGEEYWQALLEVSYWVIEIDCTGDDGKVHYRITPTSRCRRENATAEAREFEFAHPTPEDGPFFQARLMVREGSGNFGRSQRGWVGRNAGVRVYMEGFRVLPYGEVGDDWLQINADIRRTSTFRFLEGYDIPGDSVDDKEAATLFLRNDAYFGAVFLTQSGSPALRMLVNREGFIPNAGFDTLTRLVRIGIDLSVRHRALTYRERRAQRRIKRRTKAAAEERVPRSRMELKRAVEVSVQHAATLAEKAREKAAEWQFEDAQQLIDAAAREFSEASQVADRLLTEPTTMRVVASVGLQVTAYVHEINTLLTMANSVDDRLKRIRKSNKFYPGSGTVMTRLHSAVSRLRRAVERQASYLTDVTSPDGHRRRSRQKLRERFEAGIRLVEEPAKRRKIEVVNDIPDDLRSPPMFRAELAMVFANLLTNAIKAAGTDGRVRGFAQPGGNGRVVLRVENTGRRVDLSDAERWFRPFESTTAEPDPILGQGMGMGLPITRDMLEEYGAEIRFVEPSSADYTTALEIAFH